MITRRRFACASIAVLVAVLAPSPAARADAAAKAFLEKIYAAYKGKKSKGIPLDNDAEIRLYFEPSIAALMIKDENQAAKRHEVPQLEGDPFLGAQDWEIGPVEITVTDTAPEHATATAKFMNFKEPQTVTYDLVKIKQGWRIADITWQESDGTKDTLRGLYVKK
jgi:Protein of unknown function (DUF3828)